LFNQIDEAAIKDIFKSGDDTTIWNIED
jgi:hypothetical protein